MTTENTPETIYWVTDGTLPDDECLVLIETRDLDGTEIWTGYHDGVGWRTAEGMPVIDKVIAWAHMPDGSQLCDHDIELKRLKIEILALLTGIRQQIATINRLKVMLDAAQIAASRRADEITAQTIKRAASDHRSQT